MIDVIDVYKNNKKNDWLNNIFTVVDNLLIGT